MTIDRPISIALFLFATLLMVFFLVVPEYKTFKQLQTELGEKRAEFNAEFDYYAAIARVYFELQNRKEDIKKIDDALPTNSSLGKIVYFFQKTASENGIIIRNLFLSKSSKNNITVGAVNNVEDIIFSLDLLGDYPSLGNFMMAVEKSSRLFEITNIAFGSASQNMLASNQSQFQVQQISNFNLQIKTHSY
jgi:Tfp pilus assembly protein PilO